MASKQMLSLFATLVCFLLISPTRTEDEPQLKLIEANDRELQSVVHQSEYVLVFLYLGNCKDDPDCKQSMEEYAKVPEQALIQDLKILKVQDSEVGLTYNLKTFPTVLFYRRTVPIIYDANHIEAHDIVVWMEHCRQSHVQSLGDDNFEHLTQATSGATTGDWFTIFWSSKCQTIRPLWEAVGTRLMHHLNTAMVDTETNPEVVERFGIKDCPTILFLRQGKMYHYKNKEVESVNGLARYGQGEYLIGKAKEIPKGKTPIDNMSEKIVKTLKAAVGSKMALICSAVAVCLLVLVCCCCRRKSSQEKFSKIA